MYTEYIDIRPRGLCYQLSLLRAGTEKARSRSYDWKNLTCHWKLFSPWTFHFLLSCVLSCFFTCVFVNRISKKTFWLCAYVIFQNNEKIGLRHISTVTAAWTVHAPNDLTLSLMRVLRCTVNNFCASGLYLWLSGHRRGGLKKEVARSVSWYNDQGRLPAGERDDV